MPNQKLSDMFGILAGGLGGDAPGARNQILERRELKAKKAKASDLEAAKEAAADTAVALDLANHERWDDLNKHNAERLQRILARGGNPEHTINNAEKFRNPETREEAKQTLQSRVRRARLMGLLPDDDVVRGLLPETAEDKSGPFKTFNPVIIKNDETNEKKLFMPTMDKAGTASLKELDIPDGWSLAKETPEEKRLADQIDKITGKTNERRLAYIDVGQEAADSSAVLRRSIDLLDSVKTGGFAGVALKARMLFGIESADEAELSGALLKNVLAQLKPTFGSQFTAEEGARLERIEANIGKSLEGNRRLLRQTLKVAERAANRGIDAAVALKDYASAQRIQDALDFILEDPKDDESLVDADREQMKTMSDAQLEKLAGEGEP